MRGVLPDLSGVVARVQRVLRPAVAASDHHVLREGVGAPILLQPGFSMDGFAHGALVTHLGRSTGRPVWAVAAPERNTAEIGVLSARFGRALLAANAQGDGRATVVAHSYGGLIARDYLQAHEGYRLVDQLVTLGSPHAGMEFFHPVLRPLVERAPLGAVRSLSRAHGPATQLNEDLPRFMDAALAHDPRFRITNVVNASIRGGDGLVAERETRLPVARGVETATFRSGPVTGNHRGIGGIGGALDARVGALLTQVVPHAGA